MSTQHTSLTPERWGRFSLPQQLLMIANEMNRASKLLASGDSGRLRNSYSRVLVPVDLTIQVNSRPSLRRELPLWRDLIAELYIAPEADPRVTGSA